MESIKLMNMCKIVNNQTGKVLVQERVKSWQGIAFPGGKIKPGESIVLSVKREILEETGLKLNKIKRYKAICYSIFFLKKKRFLNLLRLTYFFLFLTHFSS